MDIIGKEVIHNTFRHGVIKSLNQDQITVAFKRGEKVFLYPAIFEKLMIAVDEHVNDFIQQDVAAFQAAREETDQAALAKRQEANELEMQKAMLKKVVKRASPRQAGSKKMLREPDKRALFFVFQDRKFDREHAGGYVWAPDSSPTGKHVGANPIFDVRDGDVIFTDMMPRFGHSAWQVPALFRRCIRMTCSRVRYKTPKATKSIVCIR